MTATQQGYLRFEVGGQVFAIPMADLAGIRQVDEVEQGSSEQPSSGEAMHAYVAPTDLATLFFDEDSGSDRGFILITRTQGTMVALRVDRVLPTTEASADQLYSVPSLIAPLHGPFSGMLGEAESWTLVVDTERLVSMIRQHYLDSLTEYVYDIR